MRRLAVILVTSMLALIAGCDGDAPAATVEPTPANTPSVTYLPERTPRATPSPTPTPEPPDPVGYPVGTSTGIPEVDALVAALQDNGAVPGEMWRFRDEACVTIPVNDYGPPPICPEGAAEGTPMAIVPAVACHGGYATPDTVRESFDFGRRVPTLLFGVTRPSRSLDDRAEYVVVVSLAMSSANWGMAYEVGGGGVVSVNGGCGWEPDAMWERLAISEVVLAPASDAWYGYANTVDVEGEDLITTVWRSTVFGPGYRPTLESRVAWNEDECLPFEPGRTGPPASCPVGVEGAVIPSIAVTGCHFGLRTKDGSMGAYLPEHVGSPRLFGVRAVSGWFEDVRARAVLVFQRRPAEGESEGQGFALVVSADGIVGYDDGCEKTAAEMWAGFSEQGGEVIVPAFER